MSEPMRLRSAICILFVLLLTALALGAPNEVTGQVRYGYRWRYL